MQSKGKLGSILAGVIAVLLVLVCAFYLSFTFVNSNYEGQATEVAKLAASGKQGKEADAAYNKAYKEVMDSLGEEKVYLGWTLDEVKKWGVNLGLDLKGGMNVILQADLGEMLSNMSEISTDSTFQVALETARTNVKTENSQDFIPVFIAEYKKLNPSANLGAVFGPVKQNASDAEAIAALRAEVNSQVNTSATQTLRSRIDQFGVVSPNIQVLEGKDGQILVELPGVKDHERARDLLTSQAKLEFYTTYTSPEISPILERIAAQNQGEAGAADLIALLQTGYGQGPILGYVKTSKAVSAIDSLLATPAAKDMLPSDLLIRWGVKPEVTQDKEGNEVKLGFAAYALKTTDGGPAMTGEVVTDASADMASKGFGGQEVSMTMNSEGARDWANLTRANIGKSVAIVLDDKVYSAPNVNDAITGGRSSITGNFTVDE
ncbi:MAG: protein translocase subunit SecDF, partial [Muribaculaceae bacterium]|nr:protein translocase subunit SecDF [Muribaculaceae bacterium]